jgi:N-carbamoylputrescine amidase
MTVNPTLKVAGIQQRCFEDKTTSLEHTAQQIEAAAVQGAQLVVLQELHATQYFCQTENTSYFDLAEPLKGPTFERLSQLATSHNLVIVGSIFEQRAVGLYHNTSIVIERDGTLAGFYRKMHIPDDPGFYEKFYFTPGDYTDHQGFHPIKTSVGQLGILVCWDQWYPEAARLMALRGADLLIYPTAIGWDPTDTPEEQQRQLDAWITVQRGHSVANSLPVISINRVGHEADPSQASEGIVFWGNSFITGPQGEYLAQANHQQESLVMAEIDRQRCENVRRIWPFLRDRRVDAFAELKARYLDH